MSDATFPTCSRREPLALQRGVLAAMAWARGFQHRVARSVDRSGERRPGGSLFPAAVGATDRELVRLYRWSDPEEVLRQAQTEMEVWRGRS
jgi:hypothetical protein